jgi:kynurenine aminotransferase
MWERTVTVGSAGSKFFFCLLGGSFLPFSLESFAATGWRVGWLIGPPSIINPTLAASTRIVFCTNSPLQEAVAVGLEQAAAHRFFETQLKEYQERRDLFVSAFDRLGVKYSLPEGTYFVLMVCHKFPDRNQPCSYSPSQDSSSVKFPDDYPFPETVLGRGRDFRCIFNAGLD